MAQATATAAPGMILQPRVTTSTQTTAQAPTPMNTRPNAPTNAGAKASVNEQTKPQPAMTTGGNSVVRAAAVSDEIAPQPLVQPGKLAAAVVEQVADHEKAARSHDHLERMRAILTQVTKHLEGARERRDMIKLSCVNEKLTIIKALLKVSEQAELTMQEALAQKNPEVAASAFGKIAVAHNKCEQLFAESEGCVGELAAYAGDTQVNMVIDTEPPLDLIDNLPVVDIVNRPPSASPYQ